LDLNFGSPIPQLSLMRSDQKLFMMWVAIGMVDMTVQFSTFKFDKRILGKFEAEVRKRMIDFTVVKVSKYIKTNSFQAADLHIAL
jgi:hypothetical protein